MRRQCPASGTKKAGNPIDLTYFFSLREGAPQFSVLSSPRCPRSDGSPHMRVTGGSGSLLRGAVLLPTVNFPYRRPGGRVLPDAVVPGHTALKVEIDLHGILAEGGRRARQAQRQSGN